MVVLLHVHVHVHVFDWRLADSPVQVLERWLMCEVRGRKVGLMMHMERVHVVERLRLRLLLESVRWCVSMEGVKGGCLMTDIQGSFRCRHR